jgi:hypothetical protein
MFKGQIAHGTVEGTGSAINIELGFTPAIVRVFNIDGDVNLFWNASMPAASGMKTVAAGTTAHITTNGISTYAGVEATTGLGFTIGADADVNASAETICWEAIGTE